VPVKSVLEAHPLPAAGPLIRLRPGEQRPWDCSCSWAYRCNPDPVGYAGLELKIRNSLCLAHLTPASVRA
jgi:hypothetical protein